MKLKHVKLINLLIVIGALVLANPSANSQCIPNETPSTSSLCPFSPISAATFAYYDPGLTIPAPVYCLESVLKIKSGLIFRGI